jgi:16S rRNA C1402 N4-methylase RsmH
MQYSRLVFKHFSVINTYEIQNIRSIKKELLVPDCHLGKSGKPRKLLHQTQSATLNTTPCQHKITCATPGKYKLSKMVLITTQGSFQQSTKSYNPLKKEIINYV